MFSIVSPTGLTAKAAARQEKNWQKCKEFLQGSLTCWVAMWSGKPFNKTDDGDFNAYLQQGQDEKLEFWPSTTYKSTFVDGGEVHYFNLHLVCQK